MMMLSLTRTTTCDQGSVVSEIIHGFPHKCDYYLEDLGLIVTGSCADSKCMEAESLLTGSTQVPDRVRNHHDWGSGPYQCRSP